MIGPPLLVRVIEHHEGIRVRVDRCDARAFSEVAVPTGKAEVGGFVTAPQSLRDDMVDRKAHPQHGLLTFAVGAAKLEVCGDLSAQLERQFGAAHAALGSLQQVAYVVPAPLEERRRLRSQEHGPLRVASKAL